MEKKELRDMTVEELEARKNAIASEVETDGADLDALEEEVRAIKEELEKRAAEEAKKVEIRKKDVLFGLQRPQIRMQVQFAKRNLPIAFRLYGKLGN